MSACRVTLDAPSDANYGDVTSGENATLGSGVYRSATNTATIQDDPSIATGRPTFGVVEAAEDALGGALSIVVLGPVKVRLGATWTPGNSNPHLMCNASGLWIPATDGNYATVLCTSQVAGASGQLVDAVVIPQVYNV